jgi:hypothetical protein
LNGEEFDLVTAGDQGLSGARMRHSFFTGGLIKSGQRAAGPRQKSKALVPPLAVLVDVLLILSRVT